MTTENFAVTDKMITYHLYELYYTFCDTLAEVGITAEDMGITAGSLLSTLPCHVDESVNTWLEYFANQAEYNLTEQLVLCEAAKASGMGLDDTDKAVIDGIMNDLYETAHKAGKTENAYIAELYGGWVNAGDIREAKELSYLAEKYLRQAAENADFSKNNVENYYAQHSDSIDTADFLVYVFAAGEDKYAEALASFKTAEDFLEYTKYHAVSIKGLTESDYEQIKSEHIVCENVSKDENDGIVSFAFAGKSGDVKLMKDEKSGAVTVVMVTRGGSRNEKPDENGVPMWEAVVREKLEAEAVDMAKKAAAKVHPVNMDSQKFYSIDIKA